MKNPILIKKAVELKSVLVLSMSLLLFKQCLYVSANCVSSIWERLISEEVTNFLSFLIHFNAEFHVLLY